MDGQGGSRPRRKPKSGFACSFEFRNTLPDVPADPKFVEFALNPARYATGPGALDASYNFQLHPPPDLGIGILPLLIDPPEEAADDEEPALDPRDEALLTGSIPETSDGRADMGKVSWLKATQFIDESYGLPHRAQSSGMLDEEAGEPQRERESIGQRRQRRLQEVEESFRDVPKDIANLEHPQRPGVRATRLLGMFPDFELWGESYSLVTFETDPEQKGGQDEMGGSIQNSLLIEKRRVLELEGLNEDYEPTPADGTERKASRFVHYVVPSGKQADMRNVALKALREYATDPRSVAEADEKSYICQETPEGWFYVELQRVPLSQRGRLYSGTDDPARIRDATFQWRPPNEEEYIRLVERFQESGMDALPFVQPLLRPPQ